MFPTDERPHATQSPHVVYWLTRLSIPTRPHTASVCTWQTQRSVFSTPCPPPQIRPGARPRSCPQLAPPNALCGMHSPARHLTLGMPQTARVEVPRTCHTVRPDTLHLNPVPAPDTAPKPMFLRRRRVQPTGGTEVVAALRQRCARLAAPHSRLQLPVCKACRSGGNHML